MQNDSAGKCKYLGEGEVIVSAIVKKKFHRTRV